jgi:hypothetical protein
MKTKILAGFTRSRGPGHRAPGLALARGGGAGGFHGGFAHHRFVSDRSFHFGRGFRHDHDRLFGHHFVFGGHSSICKKLYAKGQRLVKSGDFPVGFQMQMDRDKAITLSHKQNSSTCLGPARTQLNYARVRAPVCRTSPYGIIIARPADTSTRSHYS